MSLSSELNGKWMDELRLLLTLYGSVFRYPVLQHPFFSQDLWSPWWFPPPSSLPSKSGNRLLHKIGSPWLVFRWFISLDFSTSQSLAWVKWGGQLSSQLHYDIRIRISTTELSLLQNKLRGNFYSLSTFLLSEMYQGSEWKDMAVEKPGLSSSEAHPHPSSLSATQESRRDHSPVSPYSSLVSSQT